MNNRLLDSRIPRRPWATLAALLALAPSAFAEAPMPGQGIPVAVAGDAPGATAMQPAPVTTVTTTPAAPTPAAPAKYGGSLTVDTSIGLGTFVPDPQTNALVVTSFSPSGWYQLAKDLRLTTGLSLTWYQVLDVDTSLPENEALLSDISVGVSHGRIWNDPGTKFNLSGGLRIGLPTSLASQFQNRLFSLASSLTASIPVGPVSFSYTFGFGKFFNLTATSTLDCDEFSDRGECIEGRDDNPNFGFESERRGAEVYLRGSGANSYYFSNTLNVSWSILEQLSLSLALSASTSFGVRSYPVDDLSSEHATSGRAQRDRLSSSLSLFYSLNKHLSVGLSLGTDTSQPFGADGNDFPVLFDFTRASDNITSVGVSVTGSL